MKKVIAGLSALLLLASTTLACNISGKVSCPNDRTFANMLVTAEQGGAEVGFAVPDATTGLYSFHIANAGVTTITLSNLPQGIDEVTFKYSVNDGPWVEGTGTSVTIDLPASSDLALNWTIDGPACGSCWLTGGGAYIDPLLRLPMATKGNGKGKPEHSFGGNVYPGCSPTAGDGGNWNHVARDHINLHFHGTDIEVVQCGNVTPPPPNGSDSPQTPFNFIEFRGIGTLKGIQGNKADYGTVLFFARCEDHNEPGSKGAKDGALIDRYYLRVYNVINNVEVDRLVISVDDTSNGEPEDLVVPITDGNLQLHISSCDKPPAP